MVYHRVLSTELSFDAGVPLKADAGDDIFSVAPLTRRDRGAVIVDGANSQGNIASYEWSLIDDFEATNRLRSPVRLFTQGSNPGNRLNLDESQVFVRFLGGRSFNAVKGDSLTLQLTVTDYDGNQSSDTVTLWFK